MQPLITMLFMSLLVAGCGDSLKNLLGIKKDLSPTRSETSYDANSPEASRNGPEVTQDPILPDGVWLAQCSPKTNELDQPLNKGDELSLQHSYLSANSSEIIWSISSYKDKKCSDLSKASRYTFRCSVSKNKDLGDFNCLQNKLESSEDGKAWMDESMADHSGIKNVLNIYFKVTKAEGSKVELQIVSAEDEERRSIQLTKQNTK